MSETIKPFEDILSVMSYYLDKLKPFSSAFIMKLGDILRGVYVFFENEIPIYVGRTNNLKRRLREHAQGATHYDATFAFKLAKIEAEKGNVDITGSSKVLIKDEAFKMYFINSNRY